MGGIGTRVGRTRGSGTDRDGGGLASGSPDGRGGDGGAAVVKLIVIVVGAGLRDGEGGSEEGSTSWSACENARDRQRRRGEAR